ncbi:hypothetical protein DCW30_24800 [Streptomyces alfalfae]|uniref:DUF222 domain-containing protein n=1 Tax=Streptomyces alfalfae TaxID=1642299 RepID=A0ABM6GNS5_9ACTN|nr:hypothetical protein [Streptomyces alfalfae]APY85464.1 hypothetical protein A7J05_06820 [Streptomyces alfalfae]AYA15821.1 hypothetical protein D3X13_05860 [Streptomyces fradiae]RXX39298.1 hypothetical protein DCW30_24800 [Streptomyces alfalfae]RZM96213.1 hypothetical protein D4104_15305 [Streptomyces alfalfae]
MNANPLTVPEPATAGSAASEKRQLEEALAAADFTATLETTDDEMALNLTVYSSRCPFDNTVEDATDWLRHAGIEATAALDEKTFRVVLTLATATSVRALIAALLQPWITARATAQQLEDALSDHGLTSTIDVGTASLNLHLADDELGSAVTLARLLGAPNLAEDLQLHRRRGVRRFTKRIQWLITGAIGAPVRAQVEHACEHEADRLTIEMSLEQAHRLTHRLTAEEVADPSARLQRHLTKTVGIGAYVACKPGDVPGSDRLTITMNPDQGRCLLHRLNSDGDDSPARELTTH